QRLPVIPTSGPTNATALAVTTAHLDRIIVLTFDRLESLAKSPRCAVLNFELTRRCDKARRGKQMKIGLMHVTPYSKADPAIVAKRAEELGFESYWVGDHTIVPVTSS